MPTVRIPTEEDLLVWWVWYQIMGSMQQDLEHPETIGDWIGEFHGAANDDIHRILYEELVEFREKFCSPEAK